MLENVIIPGLPKLADAAFAAPSFERQQWADRINRAQRATGKPCKVGYSHGSAGRHDAHGVFRPFGGPMIFSAWCACGQFRYDGDETGRRAAVKAHKAWVGLAVNDVVIYHGPEHTGAEFVITSVAANGRLSLRDVAWGNVQLTGVQRAFIESAGRRWAEKSCACPEHYRRSTDGRCAAYDCKEAEMSPANGARGIATLEPFEGFEGIQEEVTYDAKRAAAGQAPWVSLNGERFYANNEVEPY